jgi:phosphatidylserine/phosphatidylglycerophosphate/cardiolipin synthase-like enzyme
VKQFAIRLPGFGLIAALSITACAAPKADEDVASQSEKLVAESSYVSDTVLAELNKRPDMKGRTWNVSHDNRFAGNWLLRSPMQSLDGHAMSELDIAAICTSGNCDPDFQRERCNAQADCTQGGVCRTVSATVKKPGDAAQKLCTGHSDALYEEMYQLMISGTRIVDVTSLTPPKGPFEGAVRNAITYLSNQPNPPQVRLLFAAYPVQGVVNTTTLIKNLTRDVSKSSNINVAVGAFRSSDAPASWNHSKTVAVDGRESIVGGHNMWNRDYLQQDPVHDLSLHVRGSAAGDAHRFANQLWKYTCENMTLVTWFTWSVWSNLWSHGNVTTGCPRTYDLPQVETESTATVISVGRLGTGIVKDGNQSDAAFSALIRAARHTVRISSQDIGPVLAPVVNVPLGGWPDDQIGELANALTRGVEVYIVLSNLKASAGGMSPVEAQYSNGWSPTDIGKHIRDYMQVRAGYPHDAALRALLCDKLHLTSLRYGADATWPSGVPMANHDKVIVTDDQAFYVGSQNLYLAGLQEFGYIVDDSRVTGEFLARDWDVLWHHSSAVATSGNGAPVCEL